MTDEKNRGDRRHFLRCGLTGTLALAGMAAAKTARAQDFPKASKEAANYSDHAVTQTCAECSLFLPPDDCKVVQGPVDPMGTCIYFNQ